MFRSHHMSLVGQSTEERTCIRAVQFLQLFSRPFSEKKSEEFCRTNHPTLWHKLNFSVLLDRLLDKSIVFKHFERFITLHIPNSYGSDSLISLIISFYYCGCFDADKSQKLLEESFRRIKGAAGFTQVKDFEVQDPCVLDDVFIEQKHAAKGLCTSENPSSE